MIRVISRLFEAFDQVDPDSKQNSIWRLLVAAVFNFVWFMLLSNIGFGFLAQNDFGSSFFLIGSKKIWVKKIGSKIIWVNNKNLTQKHLGRIFFWDPKSMWVGNFC